MIGGPEDSHSQPNQPWKDNPEEEQRSGTKKVRPGQMAGNQHTLSDGKRCKKRGPG
jgi:hypothetical protein